MMKCFYKQLKYDKIKINWNKNPIKMELFLSFLTVDVERSTKHFGSSTGWTLLKGDDDLNIGGGVISGVEYLDSIKYRSNLSNPYNNFVNPFFLFDILNNEGRKFFINYYSSEIEEILKNSTRLVTQTEQAFERAKENNRKTLAFWSELGIKLINESMEG